MHCPRFRNERPSDVASVLQLCRQRLALFRLSRGAACAGALATPTPIEITVATRSAAARRRLSPLLLESASLSILLPRRLRRRAPNALAEIRAMSCNTNIGGRFGRDESADEGTRTDP